MRELNPGKFQSPVPILLKTRNLIFGEDRPDIYTRITFHINLLIWAAFMIWNLFSYFAITLRTIIQQQKGIPVETIIQERGLTLGFEYDEFLPRLLTFHGIAIICWALFFFGLILLYRKKKQFSYFIFGSAIFYIGMSILYLSFTYFIEDTTTFDKIALLVLLASCSLYAYLLKNERNGGSISFFGEVQDEVDLLD